MPRNAMHTARSTRTRKPVLGEDFLVETPYRRRIVKKPINKRGTVLSVKFDASVASEASVAVEASAFPPHEALVMPRIGLWTPDEDVLLLDAVVALGPKAGWRVIAERVPGRTSKQCRERHHNHLDPGISKKGWTAQEDMVIHLGVQQRGHKWSEIARGMPGRTDNDVKNRYNVTVQEMRVFEGAESYFDEEPALYELKRLNAKAEAQGTLDRFAQQRDNRGVRWTSEEHARLERELPANTPSHLINWTHVARAVQTRNACACKYHWDRCQLKPWAPPTREEEHARVNDLEVTACADDHDYGLAIAHDLVGAACSDMLAECAEEPSRMGIVPTAATPFTDPHGLMALETYDEGTDQSWTKSSVMVVGLTRESRSSFRFPHRSVRKVVPSVKLAAKRAKVDTATRSAWLWHKENRAAAASRASDVAKVAKAARAARALTAARAARAERLARVQVGAVEAVGAVMEEAEAWSVLRSSSMTDHFQERKLRHEAEALVKTLFA